MSKAKQMHACENKNKFESNFEKFYGLPTYQIFFFCFFLLLLTFYFTSTPHLLPSFPFLDSYILS